MDDFKKVNIVVKQGIEDSRCKGYSHIILVVMETWKGCKIVAMHFPCPEKL